MHELVGSLRSLVERTLRPLVADAPALALLDFPAYANVGDSAIWLGALEALAAIGAGPIRYSCDVGTYRRDHLERRLGHGVILLSGGGNLGDSWPRFQRLREDVISSFHDHRIVQLPQSIHFGDHAALERARRVFDAHPDLTLLVRDVRSLEIAREAFRARSELCPDLAFALGMLGRATRPVRDIAWLARTDHESTRPSVSDVSAPVPFDWSPEPRSGLIRLTDAARHVIGRRPSLAGVLRRPLSAAYPYLARQRLERGRRLLSECRVVVTDRLHGHVLALLLEIPHVLLPEASGKLRAFYETWTAESNLVHWSDSPDEAFARARTLVEEQRAGVSAAVPRAAAT